MLGGMQGDNIPYGHRGKGLKSPAHDLKWWRVKKKPIYLRVIEMVAKTYQTLNGNLMCWLLQRNLNNQGAL